jgi:hypothetical protein
MPKAAFITSCAVCRRLWRADDEHWRAHHVGDDLDAPAELMFYCPQCVEREFNV